MLRIKPCRIGDDLADPTAQFRLELRIIRSAGCPNDDVARHRGHRPVVARLGPRQRLVLGDLLDSPAKLPPQHGDPGIGLAERLQGMDRDRTLPGLRFVIAGLALRLGVASLGAGLAQEINLADADSTSVALAAEIQLFAEMAPADDLAVGVVYRQNPLADADPGEKLFAVGVLKDVRRLCEGRRQRFRRADPEIFAPGPGCWLATRRSCRA